MLRSYFFHGQAGNRQPLHVLPILAMPTGVPVVCRWSAGRPRRIASPWLLLLVVLLLLLAFPLALHAQTLPPVTGNPDLTLACGLDVILILDESGSVGQSAQTVRDGARALLTALADTGSRLALIEFNAQARAPLGAAYLPITTGPNGTVSPGGELDTYLNTGYNPTDATNWDGALELAAQVNTNHGIADLVIFFTDGNPNIYVTADGNNQPGDATTALAEAMVTANLVKSQGSHLFVVGVGAVTESNLAHISGPDQYPNATLPFGQTDYTLVTFAEFITTLRTIAYNLCTPYLIVNKVVDEGHGAGYQPQAGWRFTSTVQVTQAGQPAHQFSWLAPNTGPASQLGPSQASTTNRSGVSQWQWAPGTADDPEPWSTALLLQEEARPNYQWIDATCLRRTLDPLNAVVEETFPLAAFPATILYGPNDVVSCTVRNARLALAVEKSALPTSLPEPGGIVTYTFTLTNRGAVALSGVTLVDERLNNLQGQGTCLPNGPLSLAPGAVYRCRVVTTLLGNAGTVFAEQVTATAVVNNQTLRATDTAIVTLTDVLPAALVRKSAQPTSLPERGGPVAFTITVTNLSAVEALQLTALVDHPFGDVTQLSSSVLATTCAVPQTLALAGQPGDSYSCIFTANVVGNAGPYPDVVTATLVDDEANPVTPTAQAVVTLTDVPSSLRVTKSADRTAVPEPGGPVVFTVVVENTSLVDQVTLTALVDSLVPAIATSCDQPLPVLLDPGEQLHCSYPLQVQGNLGATFTNEVVATGTDDDGQPVSDQDQVTVSIANIPSSLLVTKRAATTTVLEPGEPVSYTVVVRNTSPADAVTITTLTDSAVVDVQAFCQPVLPALLAPGEALICRYQNLVTGPVGAIVVNHFTASGVDDDGNPLTAADQEEVRVVDRPASVAVSKVATPAQVPETGGAVLYQLTIRNTSAVDQVTIQQVRDDRFGDVSSTCTPAVPVLLPVNGTTTCAFTRLLSGDVATPHHNVATASGMDDDGFPVTGNGAAVVTFSDVKPTLTAAKVATPGQVLETGGMVTFRFTMVNPGLEPSTLVQLLDSFFGNLHGQGTCQTPQPLPAGGSYQCTLTALIQGTFGVNHANVLAAYSQDNEGNVTTATARATVTLVDAAPNLTITKRDEWAKDKANELPAYQGIVSPGDTLTYTMVIANQGNQAALNVIFEDTPDANSELVAGTVRTTQGVIPIGNIPGETKVVVAVGAVAPGEQVTIQFAVLVTEGTGANQLINQADLRSEDPTTPGGTNQALSDDPDTTAPSDATITPVAIPPTGLLPVAEPPVAAEAPLPSAAPLQLYLPMIRY
ncbi:MAG: DUF11 domain-containing protein [Caldilineaceae bacterium]|nr:DUF11 domain-containing protein [Caldilineaceae bacterium]